MNNIKKSSWIRWTAYFNAMSGYSESARSIVKGLYNNDFLVNTYSPPFKKIARLPEDMQGMLAYLSKVDLEDRYIDIQHIIPESLKIDKDAGYRIGRIFFELDGIPRDWSEKINKLDEIWAASEHIKKAFCSSGIDEDKIKIIPECIDIEKYSDDIKPLKIPGKKKFAFLSIFDWRLQKGWDLLIESFAGEFTGDDDVCLVLKVFSSAGFPIDEMKEQVMGYMVKKMGLKKGKVPHIIFVEDMLSTEDMIKLYSACNCFVLPSRGEGWGRPYMEAMLMNKPVIGTRWGGHLDFMDDSNSFLIDCDVKKVSPEGIIEVPNYKGLNWAEPRIDSIKGLMRDVYGNYGGAMERARAGSVCIREKYSLDAVAGMAIKRLGEIKKDMDRQGLSSGSIMGEKEGSLKGAGDGPGLMKAVLEGEFLSHRSLSHLNREISRQSADSKIDLLIKTDEDLDRYFRSKFGKGSNKESSFLKKYFSLNREEISNIISRRGSENAIKDCGYYISHQSPPSFEAPADGYWIMMQPWEFGSLPTDWIEPFNNRIDEIWVYTEFLKKCYINSGIKADKISVIHPGIDHNIFSRKAGIYDLDTKKGFKFLFVGGSIARKGIDNLLNAYINEFSADEDVCLIIKDILTDSVYSNLNISGEIEKVSGDPDYPEILYIKENFNDLKMVASLYNASDCLVHPYKAEGFALPIAEAMSCNIPVIVPDHGACLDFCNKDNAYLIDCTVEKFKEKKVGTIETVDYPFWADVDIKDLRKKMRHVYENTAEASLKAKKAREDIRKDFGWDNTLKEMEDSLEKLGQKKILRKNAGIRDHRKEDAASIYQRAIRSFESGDKKEGKKLLEKVLEADPFHGEALKSLSYYYLKRGMHEKAIKMLFDHLKKSIDDDETINLLGTYLMQAKQHGLAAVFFKEALGMNPGNKTIQNNLDLAKKAAGKTGKGSISFKYKYLIELIEKRNSAAATVALCMIVKNEQDDLEKCLMSVRDIVSEIIIVDTGSTDGTKDIAKRFNAKIIDHPWEDDFSKARNKSIQEVDSDWILFIDADEYIDESSIPFFKGLHNIEEPCIYYSKIVNLAEEDGGDQSSEHYSMRLFNNRKGFRFIGCIHEQLALADENMEYTKRMSGISLWHTGYSKDSMDDKNKNDRNHRLLIKAVKNEPDNTFHLYNLGVHYYSAKKYRKSIETFNMMNEKLGQEVRSYLPFAYSFLAGAYTVEKNYAEAVINAEKALELAPDLKDALYNLANAKFYSNDFEGAIEYFMKAAGGEEEIFLGGSVDKGARGWKSYNGAAAAYLHLEKYTEAAELLEKAYEEEDKSAMIILNLVIAYRNLNETAKIKELIKGIGDIVFDIAQIQQLINQLLHIKLAREALKVLEETISVYEKNRMTKDSRGNEASILKGNMAEIFFAMEDHSESVKWYKRYFEIYKEDGEAYKKCGSANFFLGEKEQALKYFMLALKFENTDWEIHNNIGTIKREMGEFDEAAAYFKKAMDINPDCPGIYLKLGKTYILSKEYNRANIVLENAIGRSTENISINTENELPELLFANSEALFYQEEYDKAIDELLMYIEMDKDNADAYNRLGLCLYRTGNYKEAAGCFSNASEINNKNPNYYVNLGNAMRKENIYNDAKLAYECALLLDKDNAIAKMGLEAMAINRSLEK